MASSSTTRRPFSSCCVFLSKKRATRRSRHAPADLHAVDVGQHEVEDHKVEALAGEGLQRLLAVACRDHLVALFFERKTQQLENGLLVVYEEDAGSGLSHRLSFLSASSGVRGAARPRVRKPAPSAVAITSQPGRSASG